MQQELSRRPTAQQIQEELDKRMKLIETLLEKVAASGDRGEFHSKDANYHRPRPWSGSKDKVDFVEFSNALKNWAEVLYDKGVEIMEKYEVSKTPITADMLDRRTHPCVDKFDKMLYTELVVCLSGEPSKFVTNQKRGQGLAVWREVVQFYDSRSQVDKSAAYAKISHPQRRAKTLTEAVELMNQWESLVNNYEARHEVISDIAKITALKQILPECILQGFRGRMYDKYLVYKQDINNYINDKHAVSATARTTGCTPMELDVVADKADCDDKEKEYCNEEVLAWTSGPSYQGHKGKGKGEKGKGAPGKDQWGTGPGWKGAAPSWGTPWTQWEAPAWRWSTPTAKGSVREAEKGKSGKGGQKGDKGKGKGKQCYSCKGWGHVAAQCPTKVMAVEEIDNNMHEQDEEEEAAWLVLEEDADVEPAFQVVESRSTRRKNSKEQAQDVMELNVVEETRGKWTKVSAGIDSCAGNTVIPVDMFPELPVKQTEQSKAGKEFTCANGDKIRNEGEKVIPFFTAEGEKKSVRAQRTKVTRMLIAVNKLNKAGYQVSLDAENPLIRNTATGKVTKLRMKNGIFLIDLWVDTEVTGPVFHRQGS